MDRLLPADVAVQRCPRAPRALGHLVDADSLESALENEFGGGRIDAFHRQLMTITAGQPVCAFRFNMSHHETKIAKDSHLRTHSTAVTSIECENDESGENL